jgi:hypothetical protein
MARTGGLQGEHANVEADFTEETIDPPARSETRQKPPTKIE